MLYLLQFAFSLEEKRLGLSKYEMTMFPESTSCLISYNLIFLNEGKWVSAYGKELLYVVQYVFQ